MLALEARAAGQVGGAGLPVEEVDQRERQVLGGVRELAAGLGQRLVRAELGGRPGTEVAQRAHPPVPDDLLGVLGDHAEHARDRALVVGEWAVGEGVVRLLHVAAALQEQLQRLVPGRLTRAQHVLDARAGVVPDLGPHHRGGLAERPRVLLAEGVAAVGLVAEEGELRAPGHPHGEARGDEHADHRLEAARPPVGRAERRRRPVHGEEVATDLAAALEHRAHARTPPRTRPGPAAPLAPDPFESRGGARVRERDGSTASRKGPDLRLVRACGQRGMDHAMSQATRSRVRSSPTSTGMPAARPSRSGNRCRSARNPMNSDPSRDTAAIRKP